MSCADFDRNQHRIRKRAIGNSRVAQAYSTDRVPHQPAALRLTCHRLRMDRTALKPNAGPSRVPKNAADLRCKSGYTHPTSPAAGTCPSGVRILGQSSLGCPIPAPSVSTRPAKFASGARCHKPTAKGLAVCRCSRTAGLGCPWRRHAFLIGLA